MRDWFSGLDMRWFNSSTSASSSCSSSRRRFWRAPATLAILTAGPLVFPRRQPEQGLVSRLLGRQRWRQRFQRILANGFGEMLDGLLHLLLDHLNQRFGTRIVDIVFHRTRLV